jgi:hypothetical protein
MTEPSNASKTPLPRNEKRFHHFAKEPPAVIPPDTKSDFMKVFEDTFQRMYGNPPEFSND